MPGFNLGMGLGLGESRAPFARNPIAALFTTGVNGAWYDPSDFSTLFQDAAGTQPVTAVEQPVGLMLDKSKGLVLGPELVAAAQGDFSNPSLWSAGAGWSVSSGVASFNGTPSALSMSPGFGYTAGSRYKIKFTKTGSLVGSLRFGSVVLDITSGMVGTITAIVAAPSTASSVFFYGDGGTGTIDDFSVQPLSGNHAYNPSGNSANFPVLSARYNLLTKTEQFNDAVWAFANTGTGTGTKTANYGIAPDGTQTAARVQLSVGVLTDRAYFYQGIAAPALATQRWYIKTNDGSTKTITMAGVGTKQIIVTGSWQLFTSSDSVFAGANPGLILGNSTPTDLSADLLVWHPDFRVSNDALNQPSYQRVNTATDYDTVGFKPYLAFNGVNQWLQTNSIDFTYGDKMFVSAGVRKLSDAGNGTLIELSSIADVNNSTFFLRAPSGGLSNYQWLSKGTALTTATPSSLVAPITNILTGLGDISGDRATLRVNGAQVEQSTADQGTGNYGSYPLYIGARGGASLWFNGRLYGLVIAGKSASASEIASTEAWLNSKTGAY